MSFVARVFMDEPKIPIVHDLYLTRGRGNILAMSTLALNNKTTTLLPSSETTRELLEHDAELPFISGIISN